MTKPQDKQKTKHQHNVKVRLVSIEKTGQRELEDLNYIMALYDNFNI